MSTKIAINGFGRIGRAVFKGALENKKLQVVAINDLMDAKTLAHLLKYDSVYRQYEKKVEAVENGLKVAGKFYPIYSEKDPANLPWKKLGVQIVAECTGRFTNKQEASGHLKAGAKRVLLSAPAKDDATQTLVYGTRFSVDCLKANKSDNVVSMASCTTNCIAPVMQVLQDNFGIEKAFMTTIHSYTADQVLVDGPHRDLRRARAAAVNIVPTTTGAAIATTKVIQGLNNAFDGISIRVPTICASLSDITAVVKKDSVTIEQINAAFKKAAKDPFYKGILNATEEPLVSSDYIGNNFSTIVDLPYTKVIGGNLIKVLAWYDNEWGYSMRMVQMTEELGKNLK